MWFHDSFMHTRHSLFINIWIIRLMSGTVHPRLSEQAELNLGKVRLDKPEIRIIEDGILSLIVSPSSILTPLNLC